VDRVDCDFSVRLCDSDGKSDYLVAEGIQRVKLRNGKVELLKLGEKTRLKVKLNLASYTFAKEHELKILLSSGNSPRYERNCHTGDNHWDESKALELSVTIYHDADNPAVLRLPLR
jgi:predicted acyl esterase